MQIRSGPPRHGLAVDVNATYVYYYYVNVVALNDRLQ